MIKKILAGILGLVAVVVIIGILQPAEVVIEEQYIIKEPVDKLQSRLSDDVSMAQWFSEATGRRIQTVEQENSRGKGHGRLAVDEAAMSEVAASVNMHFYKPLRHSVHTNFFLTSTSEGTPPPKKVVGADLWDGFLDREVAGPICWVKLWRL